jgi:hypothetical protein
MRQMVPSCARSLLACLSMGGFLSLGWANPSQSLGFRTSQAIIWWSESNPAPRSSQFVNTDQIYVLAGHAHTTENRHSREDGCSNLCEVGFVYLYVKLPALVLCQTHRLFETVVDSHYSRARLRRIATVASPLTCYM